MNDLLTFTQAKRLLSYLPADGKLFWLPRSPDLFNAGNRGKESVCKTWNKRFAGKEAFTTEDGQGYLSAAIFGKPYKAHRVIWLLHYGEWPPREVDHINGDRKCNTVSNLRLATRSENMRNQRRYNNNSSGANGVSWDAKSAKWRAYVNFDGRRINLGFFSNVEDAAAARATANQKFGFTERHGTANDNHLMAGAA